MKDYQLRVIDERDQLADKLDKLDRFMEGNVFTKLPSAEQVRMTLQRLYMQKYHDVLNERIENFE